jgi:tRNA dimethylallyltransferase
MTAHVARPMILAIGGPTASGKSALAMELAEALDAEIVCADSVQLYRGLDIGSAKPDAADRAQIPHHGLDLLDPAEQADAARYAACVGPILEGRLAAGRPTIVCGGTGLYFRALFAGLAAVPPIPVEVRASIARRLADLGPEALHAELAPYDPAAAARIAPQDRQRITRALEVVLATGRPLSAWQADPVAPNPLAAATRFVALVPARAPLRDRIAVRARQMVAAGLLDEVAGLLARGVAPDAPGLQSLGYRAAVTAWMLPPSSRPSPAVFAETLASAHARYAKRQVTWFAGEAGRDLGWRSARDADEARAALLEGA